MLSILKVIPLSFAVMTAAGLDCQSAMSEQKPIEFASEFGSVEIHANAPANMTITLGETASFNISGEEFSAYGIPKFIVFGSSLSTVQPNDYLKIGSLQVAVKNPFVIKNSKTGLANF